MTRPLSVVDTRTGEIIDLAPLHKTPPRATTRPVMRSRRRSDPVADSVWLVGLLGLLVGAIGITK